MKEGPDIALVASLLGDPARANMLTALLSGCALTAAELAEAAGVAAPTASAHIAKLEQGGLLTRRKAGRRHYFSLADADVAHVIEGLSGLAARAGHLRVRTGPRDPALRRARVCYDHLAGELGVAMYDSLVRRRFIEAGETPWLTAKGARFFASLGLDVEALAAGRRPLMKACLDWSARRSHLAGALGAALLAHVFERGWARRYPHSRAIQFSRRGEAAFARLFPPAPEARA
jgi:DNA-binding transcriptional ArsR family regulator